MPEVVAGFLDNGQMSNVMRIQGSVLASYEDDFAKYASGKALLRLQKVFNYIPRSVGNKGADDASAAGDQSGDRILILATDTGVAELAEIRFSYSDGPALFGSKTNLLSEWTEKLRGTVVNAFVREGF